MKYTRAHQIKNVGTIGHIGPPRMHPLAYAIALINEIHTNINLFGQLQTNSKGQYLNKPNRGLK